MQLVVDAELLYIRAPSDQNQEDACEDGVSLKLEETRDRAGPFILEVLLFLEPLVERLVLMPMALVCSFFQVQCFNTTQRKSMITEVWSNIEQ